MKKVLALHEHDRAAGSSADPRARGGHRSLGDRLGAHSTLAGSSRTFSFSAVERNDGSVSGQAQLQARLIGSASHVEIDCLNVFAIAVR